MHAVSFIAGELAKAIQKVLPFVPSKPTNPVLSCVYFKKLDADVQLVGFDLSSMAKYQITPLANGIPFSFCLSMPSIVYSLLTSFDKNSTVIIEFDEDNHHIRLKEQGKNDFHEFPYLNGDEYPEKLLDITDETLANHQWFRIEWG